MKKYNTCTVQYHVQFQGMNEQYKSCFSIRALHKQWKKRVIVTHFAIKIICTYLYITCNKKILLKNILAYCGYSPTSLFFFLLSEHKHCDNTATNSKGENARSRMVARLRGRVGMGTKEMSQVLGAFGLLDFTMLQPVLVWSTFLNLWTVYFFNFQNFISCCSQPQITETTDTKSADTAVHLYIFFKSIKVSSFMCGPQHTAE